MLKDPVRPATREDTGRRGGNKVAGGLSRRDLFRGAGAGVGAAVVGSLALPTMFKAAHAAQTTSAGEASEQFPSVVADPTDIPAPIHRDHAVHHDVKLVARELTAEIELGVQFQFLTFGGRVPGPFIRVRQGDTVTLTLENPAENGFQHNVDLHAVYGPGGSAAKTLVNPGESREVTFKAMYPGYFIYHCAVKNLDFHISSGMFGSILVEPPEGLPHVDREFYLGQNEVYTTRKVGEKGFHPFDWEAMLQEDPTYVLFNGGAYALTAGRMGAMKARTGETARIFMVNGGPNLTSSFHPIGNVWTRCWPQGALASDPRRYVQTDLVAPGSTCVAEMDLPVPETVKLVDHALTRVARKGLLAALEVEGPQNVNIFRVASR